jgi:hypothetical protein
MADTEISVTGGEQMLVDGAVEEVEKSLSDAARSGQSRLAWFTERETGRRVALNPAHVISIRQHSPATEKDADAGRE